MSYIVMAYIVMAYIVIAYVDMAYVVKARDPAFGRMPFRCHGVSSPALSRPLPHNITSTLEERSIKILHRTCEGSIYTVMPWISIAYTVMAYTVMMAYIGAACILMAHKACTLMAYMVIAYMVMAYIVITYT